jgi:hypothetical protein
VFENELLELLKSLTEAINICNQNVTCPAYADDVSMIAMSKQALQVMFRVAYKYSCTWRFQFSASKCKVVIYGKDKDADTKIKLGLSEICESECETHLGVGLCVNQRAETEYMKSRVSSCRSVLYAIKGIGSNRVPVTPVTASKLYWSVCIPKLTYGFEVMNVKASSLETVETFHYHAAKTIQGLPAQAVNIGSLATLGWQSIDVHIDYLRLMFLWRLLLLPMSSMYKVILLRRLFHFIQNYMHNDKACGPTWNMLNTCIKYGLQQFVINAIEAGEFCNMSHWKRMVRILFEDHYDKRWTVTHALYKSLANLSGEQLHIMSPWWHHAHVNPAVLHQSRVIIQLLLNKDRHLHGVCQCCKAYLPRSTEHALFECDATLEIRKSLWSKFKSSSPTNMVIGMNVMSTKERCNFILNGLNCIYVPEWKSVYDSLSEYVYKVYMHYTCTNESFDHI